MKETHKSRILYVTLAILMVALGASDALRGIFAPVFQSHFGLNAFQISMIMTVSYAGNLLFLLIGTKLADRYQKKKVFLGVLLLWILAVGLYLVTDSYWMLLIGVFITMGASTLLNTMINLLTPLLFLSPVMIVNTLFFAQGMGTSASQGILGCFASDFNWWKLTNGVLLILGIIAFLLFYKVEIPEKTERVDKKGSSIREVVSNPAFIYLFLIFGCYFVAEHGIMNWFVIYSKEQLGLVEGQASLYLSLFFGGITIGRFIFAPVVQKLGTIKSIKYFGVVGVIFYIGAVAFGIKGTLFLLGLSGLFLSVIYPTLVLSVQGFYPEDCVASATGTIISLATLFDIVFNVVFGKTIDLFGYRIGFMILPISLLCFFGIFLIFIKKVKMKRYI